MYNRLVLPLVAASALAFACGPRAHSAVEQPTPSLELAETAATAVDPAGTVAANLAVDVGDQVELTLEVANASDRRIELRFPNGQTHDMTVLDAAGREVWRWSKGRLFTSADQNRIVGSGETVSFGVKMKDDLPAGSYTAVATLTSSNHPVEVRKGFELR